MSLKEHFTVCMCAHIRQSDDEEESKKAEINPQLCNEEESPSGLISPAASFSTEIENEEAKRSEEDDEDGLNLFRLRTL